MEINGSLKINKNDQKTITIGILGAPINNGNMGCLALTYSLLVMLEDISNDLGMKFVYYDFEGVEDSEKTRRLCQNLNIEENRIRSINIYPVESLLGFCHRPHKVFSTISALNECHFFIDMTQGDSFADIYGDSVFNKNANGKLLVENMLKKPLILGPQTYGPYKKDNNKNKAKRAIDAAALVIARDDTSAKYIKSFTDKQVHSTTDLAFRLPYRKSDNKSAEGKEHSILKVGVNVSGLLSKNKFESTPMEIKLKTDYDDYINGLLSWLLDNDYEVDLIPHVVPDFECNKIVSRKFPQVGQVEMYQNPVDIKSRISEYDIFIGARMHATIGAFSSGVATIPTAYSRKFNGLYESLDYPHIVDLLNDSTERNLEKTKEYIKQYKKLKFAAQKSMDKVNSLGKETERLLKEQVLRLIKY